jgi:F0F1-type ATP synthase assembly protein I
MTNSNDNRNKKPLTNFAKYSGIGLQMLVTIGVFAFIGYKIDAYRNSSKPIFTAIFSLIGTILSLYQVVRSLNKNKE